jgi:hypothetical protein
MVARQFTLALLLKTKSFTICPTPKEKEKKRTSQSNFQNKTIENKLRNQTFQKKSYEKSIQLIKNCTTLR